MSPLLRKELRLILPAWLLALALAVLPAWLFWPAGQGNIPQPPGALIFVPFSLGVFLLGITPFGGELSLGTFSALLAQPVPRRHLWLAKTVLVAVALIIVFVALCISNQLRVDAVLGTMKSTAWQHSFRRPGQPDKFFLNLITETRQAALHATWLIGSLSILAAFAGGLWTTLLFRQTSAAFWSTVLVPLALGLLTAKLLSGFSDGIVAVGLLLVLGLYAVAGVIWAWRFFARVQDMQWTGGVVSLPSWAGVAARPAEGVTTQSRKPLRALLRNELQLQYINLLIAGGLLVLHVGILLFRKINSDYLAAHVSWAMICESLPLLWLAVPLLVGSVAVAEERKLGTLESLLSLSTTRRFQFLVKLAVALALGVFFGAVLPITLEQLGSWGGITTNPSGYWVINASRSTAFVLLFGSIGFSVLAFLGSTLTRNTLQALGAGVLISVLGFLCFALAVEPPNPGDIVLWRGNLARFIGAPVMALTVLKLAYGNYKRLQPDLRAWRQTGLTLMVALTAVAATTTAVYHRFWEAWMPLEPTHRFYSSYYASRQPQFPAVPKLQATLANIALLLPDGQLWLRNRSVKMHQFQVEDRLVTIPQPKGFWHSNKLPGSNWRAVAASDTSCFAIQANGSLWQVSSNESIGASSPAPRRVDPGSDWKAISAGGEHFTALKSDGTLWEWGQTPTALGTRLGYKRLAIPTRVGEEADWVAVADGERMSVAVKPDGSIWRWGHFYLNNTNGPSNWRIAERPERWLEGPAQLPRCISLQGNAIAIVYEDGTLWGAYLRLFYKSENAELATRQMVPWGEDMDWKEVKIYSWDKAVGIKKDGSLWRWQSLSASWENKTWLLSRTKPSAYSDWLAVCPGRDDFLAFAADGSLCRWLDPGYAVYELNQPDPRRLLLPSRLHATRIAAIPW
jgi:hypothetical protein